MPAKREICYPIFLECSQYAIDTYWENIFCDLAYAKPPYGTYISKGFLCCSYKKKEFSYKIEKKEAKVIYTEVYDLLTRKLGLLSNIERIKKKRDISILENNMKEARKTWADIRKKNIKELLIELYVAKKKSEFSLTLEQVRFLLSIIYVAIVFKVITSDDIVYENGKITHIDGIDFTKHQIFFERDLYSIETGFSHHIVADKKLVSETWDKYIEDLRKIS